MILELSPNVKISLADVEGLKVERKVTKTGYSLTLSKGGESLSIETEGREVSVGIKDYRIREDKLIELAEAGIFDIIRREMRGREFPLERKEEEIIIDLSKIKENEKVEGFLALLKKEAERVSVVTKREEKKTELPPQELFSVAENLYQQGRRLAQKGDFGGAIKKYNKARMLTPNRDDIRCNLILALLRRYSKSGKENDNRWVNQLMYGKELNLKYREKIDRALMRGDNVIDFGQT